jgi:hypothetical protein
MCINYAGFVIAYIFTLDRLNYNVDLLPKQ